MSEKSHSHLNKETELSPPWSPPWSPDQSSFRFRPDLSAYSDACSSLSSPLCSHTSFTYPIGESVKYLWPCRKGWTHMWRGVSCPGLPDVPDITEACQLCGWALNGSLSLISHSSFTMTPLFSCYYSTPGGSVWKSWPDEYGLCICCWVLGERAHIWLGSAELFVKDMEMALMHVEI